MKTDTETFYVIANVSGGYRCPTFIRELDTGTTDSWGSAETADRFGTRKHAEAYIRREIEKNCRHAYKPMRVRIDVKLYN